MKETLQQILQEAYNHPNLNWIEKKFKDLTNEVKNDTEKDLEFTQKEYDTLNAFGVYCKIKVYQEDSGLGSESIQGGYWDEYDKCPVVEVTNDFLKNFLPENIKNGNFLDCKNAFKSLIVHEETHKDQNKEIDDDVYAFDFVEYYDGDDLQKHIMQNTEFDAYSRSIAQSLLNYGLSKKDALIALQNPEKIQQILNSFERHDKKAFVNLSSFVKRKRDYKMWNKFLRHIYDYYYNDK